MVIVMRVGATQSEISNVVDRVEKVGLRAHLSEGNERVIIGAIGDAGLARQDQFVHLPGVDRVMPISRPYKLASREFCPQNSSFRLDGVRMGGDGIVIIAGPCAVESRSQMLETALAVKEAGAHVLRGGAYKPRTSPYSFQGLGEAGLEILAEVARSDRAAGRDRGDVARTGPAGRRATPMCSRSARATCRTSPCCMPPGESQHPVLLKRGLSATVEELLMAAEYILSHGNRRVILCERGIRTFETSTRNTTDINAIPVLKSLTHLPVILDPSHSTGHWEFVEAIARAGIAAGADGLIVEVHPSPGRGALRRRAEPQTRALCRDGPPGPGGGPSGRAQRAR